MSYRRRIHGICTVFIVVMDGIAWSTAAITYGEARSVWWDIPFIVLMLGSGLLGELAGNLLMSDLPHPEDYGPPPS